MNCLIVDGVCHCACHTIPGVLHIVACCDRPPADPDAGKLPLDTRGTEE